MSTTTSFSGTTTGILIDTVICDILTGSSVTDAVKRIITEGNEKGIAGGILADVVIATVSTQCKPLVSKAENAIAKLWGPTSVSPDAPPTTATVQATFVSQDEASIAAALGLETSTVDVTISAICEDFAGRRLQDPMAEIRSAVPHAQTEQLGQLNGLIWLVTQRCQPLSQQVDALTQGVVSYVLANSSQADVAPPVVYPPQFSQQTPDPRDMNRDDVTMSWVAFDAGGIKTFSIYTSSNGAPYKLFGLKYQWRGVVYSSSTSITLVKGSTYRFAIAAEDNAGNWSPWTYSDVQAT